MSETGIRPFLCDTIEKALVRGEWAKWLRSLELYLASEEITDPLKKRNKLLHLGGSQLQEVAYNIPGAIVIYDPEKKNDVFSILTAKLSEYFSLSRIRHSRDIYLEASNPRAMKISTSFS